jgi:hypothetical protein
MSNVTCFFQTFVSTYQTKWWHNTDHHSLLLNPVSMLAHTLQSPSCSQAWEVWGFCVSIKIMWLSQIWYHMVHLETFWMNVWAPSSLCKTEESGCSKMLMFVQNGFSVTGFWSHIYLQQTWNCCDLHIFMQCPRSSFDRCRVDRVARWPLIPV